MVWTFFLLLSLLQQNIFFYVHHVKVNCVLWISLYILSEMKNVKQMIAHQGQALWFLKLHDMYWLMYELVLLKKQIWLVWKITDTSWLAGEEWELVEVSDPVHYNWSNILLNRIVKAWQEWTGASPLPSDKWRMKWSASGMTMTATTSLLWPRAAVFIVWVVSIELIPYWSAYSQSYSKVNETYLDARLTQVIQFWTVD